MIKRNAGTELIVAVLEAALESCFKFYARRDFGKRLFGLVGFGEPGFED